MSQSVHSVLNSSTIGAADKRRHFVATAIGDARDLYTSIASWLELSDKPISSTRRRTVLNDFR